MPFSPAAKIAAAIQEHTVAIFYDARIVLICSKIAIQHLQNLVAVSIMYQYFYVHSQFSLEAVARNNLVVGSCICVPV